MGFVVSTSSSDVTADKAHRLSAGVQVRAEKKGLLFYNRKGPRLFFISSGALLTTEYFGSGQAIDGWLSSTGTGTPEIHAALRDALAALVEKGVLIAD